MSFFRHLGKKASKFQFVFTILDVIGVQSSDPGPAGWNVAGVTGATKDHTLVRKSSISTGNSNWENSSGSSTSNSEWEVKDIDDWTSLGSR